MEGVRVTRWRKYGKDRLYVADAAGGSLGWFDLVTESAHPASPDHAGMLAAAVDEWRIARDESVDRELAHPVEPSSIVEEVTPSAAAREEEPDLARNVAGSMAREQAVALRQAAPVRTFLARALGVRTDERAWRIGADGEEKTAAQLARLCAKDPRWHALHAIPVGERGSDIDHVVIGPGGVFTLNSKHHPGASIWVGGNTFMVNGQRQPYVRNSRFEAERATKLLTAACAFPVFATGVIVPVGADTVTIKEAPEGVHVVYRSAIRRWLASRPIILEEDAAEVVYAAARRPSTWRT